MDVMSILTNPYFLLIVFVLVVYVGMVILVRLSGYPERLRRLIGVKGSFKIRLTIFEKRAGPNNFKILHTLGRRFVRKDRTEVYQTIGFGDIPASQLAEVYEGMTSGEMFVARFGSSDWRPLLVNELDDIYEERDVYEDITDSDGVVVGKRKVKKRFKKHAFIPMRMEQKIYYRDQVKTAHTQYKGQMDNWTKFMPMIILLVLSFAIVVVLYVGASEISEVSKSNVGIADRMDSIASKLSNASIHYTYSYQEYPYNTGG